MERGKFRTILHDILFLILFIGSFYIEETLNMWHLCQDLSPQRPDSRLPPPQENQPLSLQQKGSPYLLPWRPTQCGGGWKWLHKAAQMRWGRKQHKWPKEIGKGRRTWSGGPKHQGNLEESKNLQIQGCTRHWSTLKLKDLQAKGPHPSWMDWPVGRAGNGGVKGEWDGTYWTPLKDKGGECQPCLAESWMPSQEEESEGTLNPSFSSPLVSRQKACWTLEKPEQGHSASSLAPQEASCSLGIAPVPEDSRLQSLSQKTMQGPSWRKGCLSTMQHLCRGGGAQQPPQWRGPSMASSLNNSGPRVEGWNSPPHRWGEITALPLPSLSSLPATHCYPRSKLS